MIAIASYLMKTETGLKMTSFNTYLKFYRIWMNESDARKAAKRMMRLQHKFTRGPEK